ncbi:MAG: hypothetical protein AB7O88_09975 [Reyranellaceae bacterium]
MSADQSSFAPRWRQVDGKPVSCLEKIKVLNENLEEIRAMIADAVEDGVLMGCDPEQIRAVFHDLVEAAAADAPPAKRDE